MLTRSPGCQSQSLPTTTPPTRPPTRPPSSLTMASTLPSPPPLLSLLRLQPLPPPTLTPSAMCNSPSPRSWLWPRPSKLPKPTHTAAISPSRLETVSAFPPATSPYSTIPPPSSALVSLARSPSFTISAVISPVKVKLALPAAMSRVHPVFHVSKLPPWTDTSDSQFPDRPAPDQPIPAAKLQYRYVCYVSLEVLHRLCRVLLSSWLQSALPSPQGPWSQRRQQYASFLTALVGEGAQPRPSSHGPHYSCPPQSHHCSHYYRPAYMHGFLPPLRPPPPLLTQMSPCLCD